MARNEDEFAKVYEFAMSDPPWVPRAMLDVMARERMANFELETEDLRADSWRPRSRSASRGSRRRASSSGAARTARSTSALPMCCTALLPNSQVVILEGIGHLPMLEAPERSADDYLGFRASLH